MRGDAASSQKSEMGSRLRLQTSLNFLHFKMLQYFFFSDILQFDSSNLFNNIQEEDFFQKWLVRNCRQAMYLWSLLVIGIGLCSDLGQNTNIGENNDGQAAAVNLNEVN